jgi:biotin carboxyl carrier protein
MQQQFQVGDRVETVSVESRGDGFSVTVGDQTFEVGCTQTSPESLSLLIGDQSVVAYVAQSGDQVYVSIQGEEFVFSKVAGGSRRSGDVVDGGMLARGVYEISSPMPGKVVKVNVSQGDRVKKGQSIAVVEAMKMENDLRSPAEAVVDSVNAQAGDQVNAGETIVELKIPEKEEE